MAVTATCAVMDVIEWLKLPEKAQEIGRHLNRRLKEEILEFACVGDIRGMGFFQGIDIVTDKTSKK